MTAEKRWVAASEVERSIGSVENILSCFTSYHVTTLTAHGKHQAEKLGLNVYMHEKQRDVITKKNEKGL